MVSLVTGGASGLGKATVERLARNGGRVVILDIQGSRAQEVAKDFGEDVQVSVGCVSNFLFEICCFVPKLYIFYDIKNTFQVTSEEDVNNALKIAKSKFGRLDTLVNCAGFAQTNQVYNFNKDQPGGMEYFEKCVNVRFPILQSG